MKGIDVSYHQGAIDWKKVAKTDIEFVIIRAGYGKSTVDKKFLDNIKGAIGAGLKIGIYWFIYAKNEAEVIANAEMCDKTIRQYKEHITMKVAADWEYDSDTNSQKNGVIQTKESRTKFVRIFLEHLKNKGYEVCNYANPDYLKSKFGDLSEYPLWLARYSDKMGDYNAWMWQYSSTGKVPGINGNVDMNICYGNVEERVQYYPVPKFTLIDHLEKIGVDSSFANRKKIAEKNNIKGYIGTEVQNIKMLDLLLSGKLIKL